MSDVAHSHRATRGARGLTPRREHDVCGVAFVTRASREGSPEVLKMALQALARVAHRGAASAGRVIIWEALEQ